MVSNELTHRIRLHCPQVASWKHLRVPWAPGQVQASKREVEEVVGLTSGRSGMIISLDPASLML